MTGTLTGSGSSIIRVHGREDLDGLLGRSLATPASNLLLRNSAAHYLRNSGWRSCFTSTYPIRYVTKVLRAVLRERNRALVLDCYDSVAD